jgi:hypothetical protein
MIWAAGQVSSDFRVEGLGRGIALSVIVTMVYVIGRTLGIDDDNLYWKKVVAGRPATEGSPPPTCRACSSWRSTR